MKWTKPRHMNLNYNIHRQQIEAQQTEKLKKFAELKKQGIITEEEFQKLKADLLSKM